MKSKIYSAQFDMHTLATEICHHEEVKRLPLNEPKNSRAEFYLKNSCSYPREIRVTTSKEYNHIYKNNYRIEVHGLIALAKPNQSLTARLGTAVAKKKIALATKRNLVKRIIRESFRLNQNSVQGFDIVISVKYLNNFSKVQLRKNIEMIWVKISDLSNKLQRNKCHLAIT